MNAKRNQAERISKMYCLSQTGKKQKCKGLVKAIMEKNYVAEALMTSEFASSCVVLTDVHKAVGRQTYTWRMSNVRNRRSKNKSLCFLK